MAHLPAHPLEYERRCLVFVDVLGWSDLVRRSAADVNERRKIAEVYRRLFDTTRFIQWAEATDTQEKEIGWAATLLSDSLALSCRPEDAQRLLGHIASDFTVLLVRQELCVRGAVVVGDLYHRANVVIGPALVRAVELEKSVACYPRVLVDDSVARDIVPEELLFMDADGMATFDYLWCTGQNPGQLLKNTEAAVKIVRAKLSEHEGTPALMAKYRWLLRYVETTQASALEVQNG